MKQSLIELIAKAIELLKTQNELPFDLEPSIQIEATRDKQFGDYACNIAMILAKTLKQNPRQLAQKIISQIPQSPLVKKMVVAGPGFINFFLMETAYHSLIPDIFKKGSDFGRNNSGENIRVHIEFVSSNPTGPLHVGHGRGAAYGDSVANLLDAIGFQVHREYYVNDAGRQIDILAISIWLRYLEEFGLKISFPKNGYKGDYIIEIAKALKIKFGDKFLHDLAEVFADLPNDGKNEEDPQKEIFIDALISRTKKLLKDGYTTIHNFGIKNILADIRNDLEEFNVHFQTWFHESTLFANGAVDKTIELLQQSGHVFKKDGAVWFRATDFGDEKDRVIIRENGQPTYFAPDMAYHLNKFERGFEKTIDVFGADHHGYAPRIKAVLRAVGISPERLQVLIVQFATLYRGKERVQMSTRGGSFVTLRELRKEVGNDAARFFYIMRKPEQHLDFDLELAKSQSMDNPVYYIQYAHARICSVFRQLEVKNFHWDQQQGLEHLQLLSEEHEKDLLKCLAQYPEIVGEAAIHHEPHLIAHYLQDLAQRFHTYYNAQQFLVDDDKLRNARLNLIAATKQVIANGLKLLGVSAPEVM